MCPGKPWGWVMNEWDGSGLPNTGWVSTTLAAWKHLMAHKLAGRLNFPLALFYDAEERYLVLPAFGQSSCCAGTPGLFYFITFIFLFLYASLSEDSYLSRALLRGKAQQSTNSEMGNDLLPLVLLYFFLAGAEHRKIHPSVAAVRDSGPPQDPKEIPLVEVFGYSIHAWSKSRQPHLMIKHSLNSENTPRSYTRHYWSNTWSNIYLSYFSVSMLLLIAFYHSFPTVSMLSFSILS